MNAQNKVIIKLNESQIENMITSKVGERVAVRFGDNELDQLIGKFGFSSIYQSFPQARFFKHPASERVAQYYTLEGSFDVDELIREFRRSNSVEFAGKISEPQPLYAPNDFALQDPSGGQWALVNIKAKQAWDITKGSSLVKAAVIDFGFQTDNEELVNQIVYQDQPSFPLDAHGTSVAGSLAGETDNGKGLSSIGFRSKLMLYYETDAYNKMLSASLNGAKVINCSFKSGCDYVQYEQDIINMVVANGSIVVAAAGNGQIFGSCPIGGDGMGYHYPAAYDNVIAVSGTYQDSYFYNGTHYTFNDKVDLTAPAFNVVSPSIGNSYVVSSGTSYAAPVTSGTIALMFAVKSCLTPSEVEYILKKSADQSVNNTQLHPENAPFVNISGAGRLDAYAALQYTQTWPQTLTTTLAGPSLLCTTGMFTLNGIPQNTSSNVTWSVSPSYMVSPSSGAGVTANLTRIGIGYPIITFTYTSCGSSKTFTKQFHTGPYSSSDYQIIGSPSASCDSYVFYSIPALTGVTSINWIWPSGWTYVSGQNTSNLTLRTGSFSGVVGVGVNNTCGQSGSYATKYISVYGFCGGFSAYPNPASNELTISFINTDTTANNITKTSAEEFESPYEIKIYNDRQELLYSTQTKRMVFTIPISSFPNGEYILNVLNKEGITKRTIFVNRN